ncbi:cytochrome P450 [Xylariaceae sp. FL0016]|nr:cytochrome P450 [Xylariaceae sp. FL0016]
MASKAEWAPVWLKVDQASPLRVLAALVTVGIVYVIASSIYNVTIHPLASIPGPKLCAISRWPYFIASIKGEDVHFIRALHTRFGPVVRFGPRDVSHTSPQAWKDIYGHEKGMKDLEKPLSFFVQPVNGTTCVPSMLSTSSAQHARVRRIFSPAFSDRSLRQQESLFKRYADQLVSKLHELGEDGKPVEMTSMYNFASFDIMADICFGNPLGLLARAEYNPWLRAIFESIEMHPFAAIIGYYPVLRAIFKWFEPKKIWEMRKAHCQFSADRVDERLRVESNQPDLWNLVIEAQDRDNSLSREEMHSNAEIFMLAGSETTVINVAATLLAGITYYLLANPDILKVVYEEIRVSFPNAKDINFDSLAGLKYTNACLKEALRIYPPVPIGTPRVIGEGGRVIDGRWLPPGTWASVHINSALHFEPYFKDPYVFAPGRWLGHPEYKDDNLEAFQPFGYGPRNCIGQNMAMHELRLLLATVLHTFDLELCESMNWVDQKAFAVWKKKPLMVRFKQVVRGT